MSGRELNATREALEARRGSASARPHDDGPRRVDRAASALRQTADNRRVNDVRQPPRGVSIEPTTAASLERLQGIVSKPAVMQGYFGNAVAPGFAREVLQREWTSCDDPATGLHLTASALRRGRGEVVGA